MFVFLTLHTSSQQKMLKVSFPFKTFIWQTIRDWDTVLQLHFDRSNSILNFQYIKVTMYCEVFLWTCDWAQQETEGWIKQTWGSISPSAGDPAQLSLPQTQSTGKTPDPSQVIDFILSSGWYVSGHYKAPSSSQTVQILKLKHGWEQILITNAMILNLIPLLFGLGTYKKKVKWKRAPETSETWIIF